METTHAKLSYVIYTRVTSEKLEYDAERIHTNRRAFSIQSSGWGFSCSTDTYIIRGILDLKKERGIGADYLIDRQGHAEYQHTVPQCRELGGLRQEASDDNNPAQETEESETDFEAEESN